MTTLFGPRFVITMQYCNEILTVVLEMLDDFDSSIRELPLSLIIERLKNQKAAMEDSIEIIIEKLMHVTKDLIPQVANESEHCSSIVLSLYDPFRCLSVCIHSGSPPSLAKFLSALSKRSHWLNTNMKTLEKFCVNFWLCLVNL
ncbi:putative armadillo-like helical protein [Rosa chinensis]|uniref:Putative armadillo-like helical protein n=1 Tax=Rosa chinensis TaxID=74649 RepID=A0A2P6SBF7_ROSCH|nr:putative armadillo-like helical protein [Rosa chinensis]